MEFKPPNAVNKDGTVIYRSGMNPKIHRKKVREADPLICPTCQSEMRIVSLIDERDVIDLPAMLRLLAQASIALQAGKMLKCLGLWQQGVRVDPQRQSGADPPNGEWVYEPIDQDPFPDYDTEPVLFYANA